MNKLPKHLTKGGPGDKYLGDGKVDTSQWFKNVRQNIIFKHAERTVGTSYNVWDASLLVDVNKFTFTLIANNIFNADYIESGFVPMPTSNVLLGLRYGF